MYEDSTSSELTHIIYDKVNGQILGRYQHFDIVQDNYCECNPEEVLKPFFNDEYTMERVTDKNVDNLAVLCSSLPRSFDLSHAYISLQQRKIVALPQLDLKADSEVLKGDGCDSTTLTIAVLDEQGKVKRDYQGEVHVSTSRGKLSARGGQVKIKNGQGKVRLKSVAETVDQVQVRASTTDNSAVADEIILRFE